MSFDRSDADGDKSADQTADAPDVRRPIEADSTADIGKERSFRLPTTEERIEAHQRARQTANEVYAAWDRGAEGRTDAENQPEESARSETAAAAPGARSRDRADDGNTSRPPDKPSATEEALRERVGELEADKVARDKQLAAQGQKIAEQDKIITRQGERIERLEAYVGRITTAVTELRQQQDELQPSRDIAERARGGEAERAEWKEPQHKRRLPTDAWNLVISAAAGGTLTELAYHVPDLSPENAGLGASAFAVGAGIVAVWRERRKAKDDDDHRPRG
jgi:hypothetical protein